MAGLKRSSPESGSDSTANKKVATQRGPLEAADDNPQYDRDEDLFTSDDMVEYDDDDDDDDGYKTEEESDPSGFATLNDFLDELPLPPKHFSKSIAKSEGRLATPPFLWRVASSSKSRGLNAEEVIDPLHGTEKSYNENIEDEAYLRDMISHHLRWRYEMPSEFSSWTVSFLWMPVHASRKYYEGEKDIMVYFLDTSKLRPHRIHKAVNLVTKHDLEWFKDGRIKSNATGEYLIHGQLANYDGLWKVVRFQDLRKAVDFEEQFWADSSKEEEIEVKKNGKKKKKNVRYLHRRAIEIRFKWFAPRSNGNHYTTFGQNFWVLDMYRTVARCFGPEWEAVAIAALISMRARDYSSEATNIWIPKAFEGTKMPQLPFDEDMRLRAFHLAIPHTKLDRGDMPDSHQFMLLLRLLHDRGAQHEVEKRRKMDLRGGSWRCHHECSSTECHNIATFHSALNARFLEPAASPNTSHPTTCKLTSARIQNQNSPR